LTFNGVSSRNGNVLHWSTATERSNDYFVIERSYDALLFEEIARVKGSGDSYSTVEYEYLDVNSNVYNVYYRLKQVDYDSDFNYSKVIVVQKTRINLSVYPNPTSDELIVEGDFMEVLQFSLTNVRGNSVAVDFKIEDHRYVMDVSGLMKGVYILRVNTGTDVEVYKINIQ
jgi:hypothetical protein